MDELVQRLLFSREVGDNKVDDERDGSQSAEQPQREEDSAEHFGATNQVGVLDRERNAKSCKVGDGFIDMKQFARASLEKFETPDESDAKQEHGLKMGGSEYQVTISLAGDLGCGEEFIHKEAQLVFSESKIGIISYKNSFAGHLEGSH
jgi:hypothetical protein